MTIPTAPAAHFQDIKNKILIELDAARVSITVVMAWFTNETLGEKLIEKYKEGLEIPGMLVDSVI